MDITYPSSRKHRSPTTMPTVLPPHQLSKWVALTHSLPVETREGSDPREQPGISIEMPPPVVSQLYENEIRQTRTRSTALTWLVVRLSLSRLLGSLPREQYINGSCSCHPWRALACESSLFTGNPPIKASRVT